MIVLNNLYRLTALQSSFSCNMVGWVFFHPSYGREIECFSFHLTLFISDPFPSFAFHLHIQADFTAHLYIQLMFFVLHLVLFVIILNVFFQCIQFSVGIGAWWCLCQRIPLLAWMMEFLSSKAPYNTGQSLFWYVQVSWMVKVLYLRGRLNGYWPRFITPCLPGACGVWVSIQVRGVYLGAGMVQYNGWLLCMIILISNKEVELFFFHWIREFQVQDGKQISLQRGVWSELCTQCGKFLENHNGVLMWVRSLEYYFTGLNNIEEEMLQKILWMTDSFWDITGE